MSAKQKDKRKGVLAILLIGLFFKNEAGSLDQQQAEEGEVEVKSETKKDRLVELGKTKEWQEFKRFWKELDIILPREYDNNNIRYFMVINLDKMNELIKHLETLKLSLSGLPDYLISSEEIDLLANFCQTRIDYMCFGSIDNAMTRMVMPPNLIEDNLDKNIENFERKIDVLLDLKAKGLIDQKEGEQALLNLEENIEKIYVLKAISQNYVKFYFYWPQEKDSENYKASDYVGLFEEYYNNYKIKGRNHKEGLKEPYYYDNYTSEEDITLKYETTKKAIKEVKKNLPFLKALVIDMER